MAVSKDWTVDALLPAEMALRAEKIGVSKAQMSLFTMFALGVLAGIFIALGAIFATTVASGESPSARLPIWSSRDRYESRNVRRGRSLHLCGDRPTCHQCNGYTSWRRPSTRERLRATIAPNTRT